MMWFLAQEEAKPVLGLFVEGTIVDIIVVLLLGILIWVMVSRARTGRPIPEIKKIAGLEAIDEAIGRATEMGRPVTFIPGILSVSNAQTLAAFGVASHVARQCARYDTRLLVLTCDPLPYAVLEEITRQSYLEEGRPDAFNPDDVRFLSAEQFAFASAVIGVYERERPAANIMIGAFYAESMIFAETASFQGMISIGGTAHTHQLPFFVAACDYALIGEEIYAASAYLSKEPVLYGTVVGQDILKILVWIIILIGGIVATVNPETTFGKLFEF
ncbi:MAG TPA: hypothetical protein DHW14_09885 [Clostridiales bacterium]|nr:hypothetical protein [Clostridiales bacterium]